MSKVDPKAKKLLDKRKSLSNQLAAAHKASTRACKGKWQWQAKISPWPPDRYGQAAEALESSQPRRGTEYVAGFAWSGVARRHSSNGLCA
jgi:hypothetical protein